MPGGTKQDKFNWQVLYNTPYASRLWPYFLWCSLVLGCSVVGIGGLRGVVDLVGFGPWRAYLKRFSPAPSCQYGLFTLIWCSGILDTCMQR